MNEETDNIPWSGITNTHVWITDWDRQSWESEEEIKIGWGFPTHSQINQIQKKGEPFMSLYQQQLPHSSMWKTMTLLDNRIETRCKSQWYLWKIKMKTYSNLAYRAGSLNCMHEYLHQEGAPEAIFMSLQEDSGSKYTITQKNLIKYNFTPEITKLMYESTKTTEINRVQRHRVKVPDDDFLNER